MAPCGKGKAGRKKGPKRPKNPAAEEKGKSGRDNGPKVKRRVKRK